MAVGAAQAARRNELTREASSRLPFTLSSSKIWADGVVDLANIG
jgi:hypothetical protein